MSVMKEDGTKRLIDQILASLKVGKIAIMDKVLNINSSNPVENKVITQAINGINNRIDDECFKGEIREMTLSTPTSGTMYELNFGRMSMERNFVILDAGCYSESGSFKFGISGANYYNDTNHTIAPIVNWSVVNSGSYKELLVGIDTKSTEERTAYAVVLFY